MAESREAQDKDQEQDQDPGAVETVGRKGVPLAERQEQEAAEAKARHDEMAARLKADVAELPDASLIPNTLMQPGPALASAHAPMSQLGNLAPPAPLPNPEYPSGAPPVPTHNSLAGLTREEAVRKVNLVTSPEVLEALQKEADGNGDDKVSAAAKKRAGAVKPASDK